MTRQGFHIVLALILVGCVLCPYVEFAIGQNQTIFDTGYDTESSVAIIALVLVLAFALASLLIRFPAKTAGKEWLGVSTATLRPALEFISTLPDASPPPLSLRI